MEDTLSSRQTRLNHACSTLLATPEQWRFVCSALPHTERPLQRAAYARWADAHLHTHQQREILFCIEGDAYQRFGEKIYPCHPGTVFLFDVNEAHAVNYPLDDAPFKHIWIMVLANDAIAIIYSHQNGQVAEQRNPPVVFNKVDRDALVRAWDLAKSPLDWMSADLCRTALQTAIFSLLFRAMAKWQSSTDDAGRVRRHQDIVAAIQRHIETHLAESENLDALAHLSGYSKFHFSRMFKKCTGQTVNGFINQCRIDRAQTMLEAGELCKAIAGELGFLSPAAFSNWRRRHRL